MHGLEQLAQFFGGFAAALYQLLLTVCASHHTVHFIAPAGTSLSDDLIVARFQIQGDRTAQKHVEIFQRDRVLMSSMYGSERREIRPYATVKSYAIKVRKGSKENLAIVFQLRSCKSRVGTRGGHRSRRQRLECNIPAA
jgi:hypothetical protein